MIPESYTNLIERLARVTQERKVNWSRIEEWTYVVSFGEYSIAVSDSGRAPEIEYKFRILDDEGSEIDAFEVERGSVDFAIVSSLWEHARRNASKIDLAINKIESDLAAIEDEPPFE